MSNMAKEPQTYRTAMEELQEIVDRLRQGEEVDVDELVADVSRAKVLIDFCDKKITRADVQIKSIIVELRQPNPNESVREDEPVSPPGAGQPEEYEDIPF